MIPRKKPYNPKPLERQCPTCRGRKMLSERDKQIAGDTISRQCPDCAGTGVKIGAATYFTK